MPRVVLFVGNRIVPSPNLESDGNDHEEDYQHEQGLKIFDNSYKVHPTTLIKALLIADKDFGLL
jgi:hypothetical protein